MEQDRMASPVAVAVAAFEREEREVDETMPTQPPTPIPQHQPQQQSHDASSRTLKRLASSSSFSFLEHSNYFTLIPLYRPPRQRHRWGEPQHPPPHKHWGDIFLDLFYVAAAYNLGHLLREDPTWDGLLYLTATFFSIQSLWMLHLLQDGRFQFATETLYQSVVATVRFLALAWAVLHLRPVPYLSHPEQFNDMFLLCLSIAVCLLLHAMSCLEIMYCQRFLTEHSTVQKEEEEEEQQHASVTTHNNNNKTHHHKQIGLEPAAFDTAVSTLQIIVIPFVLVLAAVIYSGRKYYSHGGSSMSNTTTSSSSTEHQHLAAAAAAAQDQHVSPADHVAIYLLLASSLWMILFHAMRQMCYDLFKWDHKRQVVLYNSVLLVGTNTLTRIL